MIYVAVDYRFSNFKSVNRHKEENWASEDIGADIRD
jgi:hypothetical protein